MFKGPTPEGAALSDLHASNTTHRTYHLAGVTTAGGALPLGGLAAAVEGECAPAASTGFATAVAAAATYVKGPGSAQAGAPAEAGFTDLPVEAAVLK